MQNCTLSKNRAYVKNALVWRTWNNQNFERLKVLSATLSEQVTFLKLCPPVHFRRKKENHFYYTDDFLADASNYLFKNLQRKSQNHTDSVSLTVTIITNTNLKLQASPDLFLPT